MTTRKELGKIKSIRVGMGGYQDAMFGVWIEINGKSWGVNDGKGTWAWHSKGCQWSVVDQLSQFGEAMAYMRDLCRDAGVTSVDQLKGVPVEVTLDGNKLESWRILKEVL